MRLAQSSQAYGNVDRSWLVSALEGQDNNLPVTLDLSLFPTGTFASGGPNAAEVRIPAGTALGLKTATGFYGPYDPAASDGTQTCAGLLLNDEEGSGASGYQYVTTAAVRSGAVFRDRLPLVGSSTGTKGRLDTAGEGHLKLVDFRNRGVL